MSLKGKFILAIVAILAISYGLLLVYTSHLQNRLVLGQAEQQARMLYRQILITRKWIADHQGLFLLQSENTPPNTFLSEPRMTTTSGQVFIKRNPAMVTRALSQYAAHSGMGWFRVTSLKPVNPDNSPDAFEQRSLQSFEQGARKQVTIERNEKGKVLRYAAPLLTETSCLSCHSEHGDQLGDIRGALSVTIPIGWADNSIKSNNHTILILGACSIIAAGLVIFLLFNRLVSRPMGQLAKAMAAFPELPPNKQALPHTEDEIGMLSHSFIALCTRLTESQQALSAASKTGFRAEKLAALGQLTAGIAHEVNNPLAGMLNCVKSMQQQPENTALHHRYLPLIHKGLKRIESTMRQLLNYGRVAPLRIHQVEIDRVIHDCLELLGYRLRKITVELDLQFNDLCCIDSEALKQIVMNITLNATQAMESGGVLHISSRGKDETVILQFADTGPGISSEIIDRIYDPFFTTKDIGEGTGLGLAVSLSLVQQLGGQIEVASQVGQGTTFTVILPLSRECPGNKQERVNQDSDR